MIHSIGKTKIQIKAIGCIDCGAQWSTAWHEVENVAIKIRRSTYYLTINCCDECWKKRETTITANQTSGGQDEVCKNQDIEG